MTNHFRQQDDLLYEFLLLDMRLEAMAMERARKVFPQFFTPSGEGQVIVASTPRGPGDSSFYDRWKR